MSAELYINIYYFTLLVIVLSYAIGGESAIRNDSRRASFFLLIFVLTFLTFRDLDPLFGDSIGYANKFKATLHWGISEQINDKTKDIGFAAFTVLMTYFKSVTLYFGAIAIIYVLPIYYVFNRNLPEGRFIAFLLVVCSFSFWGYGVNGLRNGMATSLIIAAMFSNRLFVQLILTAIASTFHGSVLLPGAFFFIAKYYNQPKVYYIFYIICLLLSITYGNQLGTIIGGWDLIDSTDYRLQEYLQTDMDYTFGGQVLGDSFSRTGFRWDFMLYSLVPIVLGYIYIFRLGYKDRLYRILYCTYVGCNACWLLTTYVPYNNRFAYLSWFIYPVVMSYPLLKDKNLVDYQQAKLQLMVLLNYSFTLFMYYK